jgi:hypothetical protein
VLKASAARRVSHGPGCAPRHHPVCRLAEPDQTRSHQRIGGKSASRRIDIYRFIEAERLAKDELLMCERRMELRDVYLTLPDARLLTRQLR